MTNDIKLIELK